MIGYFCEPALLYPALAIASLHRRLPWRLRTEPAATGHGRFYPDCPGALVLHVSEHTASAKGKKRYALAGSLGRNRTMG